VYASWGLFGCVFRCSAVGLGLPWCLPDFFAGGRNGACGFFVFGFEAGFVL
jgi:hypothetical protein